MTRRSDSQPSGLTFADALTLIQLGVGVRRKNWLPGWFLAECTFASGALSCNYQGNPLLPGQELKVSLDPLLIICHRTFDGTTQRGTAYQWLIEDRNAKDWGQV